MDVTFLFLGRFSSDLAGNQCTHSPFDIPEDPVDFPKSRNRNDKYIKEQINTTEAMFEEIMSYSEEFWTNCGMMKLGSIHIYLLVGMTVLMTQ